MEAVVLPVFFDEGYFVVDLVKAALRSIELGWSPSGVKLGSASILQVMVPHTMIAAFRLLPRL